MKRDPTGNVAKAIYNLLPTDPDIGYYNLKYIQKSLGLSEAIISFALKELEEKGYAEKHEQIGSDTLWTKIVISPNSKILFERMELNREYDFEVLLCVIAVASLTLVEMLNELIEAGYVKEIRSGIYRRVRKNL